MKKRVFSLYDIEQFLREAGAEKINERAVLSLERELQDTVNRLLEEASVYANYAGRTRMITPSDIGLTSGRMGKYHIKYKRKLKPKAAQPNRMEVQTIAIVDESPVIRTEQRL